jgi:hypothetical protein
MDELCFYLTDKINKLCLIVLFCYASSFSLQNLPISQKFFPQKKFHIWYFILWRVVFSFWFGKRHNTKHLSAGPGTCLCMFYMRYSQIFQCTEESGKCVTFIHDMLTVETFTLLSNIDTNLYAENTVIFHLWSLGIWYYKMWKKRNRKI